MTPRGRGLALLAVFLAASRLDASAGKDGFQFLKRGAGVRQAAMADTGASVGDDVNASFWNPAILGEMSRRELSFSHTPYLEEGGLSSIAYSAPSQRGAWAGLLQYFDAGPIEGYDATDAKTADGEFKDSMFQIGYGRRWKRRTEVGANIKYISEKLTGIEAATYGVDLGLVQHLGWGGNSSPFRAALALRNLGPKATVAKEKMSLPRSLDAGISGKFFAEALVTALEFHKPADDGGYLAVGVEFWTNKTLALRAGFDNRDLAGNGLTLGVGFRFQTLGVDYALESYGEGFGPVHRIGVTLRFGRAGQRAYEEGVDLSRNGRYAEAILKFEEALDADPEHRAAGRALQEAVGSLEKEMGAGKIR